MVVLETLPGIELQPSPAETNGHETAALANELSDSVQVLIACERHGIDAERIARAEGIAQANRLIEQVCGDNKARMFLVFDCCHSGSGARGDTRTRQLAGRQLRPTAVQDAAAQPAPKKLPPGVVFLSACRAREEEPEFKDEDDES